MIKVLYFISYVLLEVRFIYLFFFSFYVNQFIYKPILKLGKEWLGVGLNIQASLIYMGFFFFFFFPDKIIN